MVLVYTGQRTRHDFRQLPQTRRRLWRRRIAEHRFLAPVTAAEGILDAEGTPLAVWRPCSGLPQGAEPDPARTGDAGQPHRPARCRRRHRVGPDDQRDRTAKRLPHIVGAAPALHRAIDEASAGRPAVILLGADSGRGKSALIGHVCRGAHVRIDNLAVLWGDCTGRSGAAGPHQPFRQLLGVMAGDTVAAGPLQLLSPANGRRIDERAPGAVRDLLAQAPGLIDRFILGDALRRQSAGGRLDPRRRGRRFPWRGGTQVRSPPKPDQDR